MTNVDEALGHIADIRAQLASTMRFRGFAPEAVAITGLVSALLTLAQMAWPASLAADSRQIVLLWGGVLAISSLAMGVEAVVRTRHQHGGMAAAMLRGAMRMIAPIFAIGLAVAAVILNFAPAAVWIVPGFWLMLIGLVAFSSVNILPPGIAWPGFWYSACGIAAMVVAGSAGQAAPWHIGAPLVIGHVWIAWILYREGKQPHGF